MKNWKIYHNYFLLSAFAFKILVPGSILTLATHNICLDRLQDVEINWSRLVSKQRKRNDEHSHTVSILDGKQDIALDGISRRVSHSVVRYFIIQFYTQVKLNLHYSSLSPDIIYLNGSLSGTAP